MTAGQDIRAELAAATIGAATFFSRVVKELEAAIEVANAQRQDRDRIDVHQHEGGCLRLVSEHSPAFDIHLMRAGTTVHLVLREVVGRAVSESSEVFPIVSVTGRRFRNGVGVLMPSAQGADGPLRQSYRIVESSEFVDGLLRKVLGSAYLSTAVTVEFSPDELQPEEPRLAVAR